MRREGFELSVGRPEVIFKEINGQTYEPYENFILKFQKHTPVLL
jgi:predicted membrane GTPase involved in stress response